MSGRIINKNPYLYGPGPVKRVPSGAMSMFGKAPPVQGFSMAAGIGIVLALGASFGFKILYGDPSIKQIEEYYKENPPK